MQRGGCGKWVPEITQPVLVLGAMMVAVSNEAGVFLTEKQVAEVLGVTVGTLRNQRYTKAEHPPFVKVGKRVLYPSDQLYKWMYLRLRKNWI